ncbi:putative metal chaperone, involved in Zn homeostasis, GTPase of COG0523 family [Alkalibacterium sp. AK22]|uniref:CobW family GTP-binding protein n=1 Tax=Alkalibacterium sp. AK22 TaxID=1229520 RepID=UPI00044952D5|nr:GTP-binding protein [Alkalibacterium sp. AK22]EXJ24438.1 putative metal chaperone, involved in Zn homeostasis, GTPase of COG0523 family [Alkalibacterium sp. AK22]
MDQKIPVTIITGFLGAGKTTLINELLHQPNEEKIAVIVNEFGDIGVDHNLVVNVEEDIYQMNNGCLCCTLRADLADMLSSIYAVRKTQEVKIDRIVIETTGLAEPGPIAQTFMRNPVLQEHYSLDSVLTLVDSGNALYQLAHYEESVEQAAFADKLLLTKVEETSDHTIHLVKQKLRTLNPFAQIEELDLEKVRVPDIIGLNLYDEQKVEQSEDHGLDHHHEADSEHKACGCGHHNDSGSCCHGQAHHHEEESTHTSNIVSLSLKTSEPIHPTLIDMWMNELIMTFGMDLLRYKGVLNLYGDSNQIIYQGVNMAFKAERGQPWGEGERESVLVFIGKNLPLEEMRESFNKCILTEEVRLELGID